MPEKLKASGAGFVLELSMLCLRWIWRHPKYRRHSGLSRCLCLPLNVHAIRKLMDWRYFTVIVGRFTLVLGLHLIPVLCPRMLKTFQSRRV